MPILMCELGGLMEDSYFHWEIIGEAEGDTVKEVADNLTKKDINFAKYYNPKTVTYFGWRLKILSEQHKKKEKGLIMKSFIINTDVDRRLKVSADYDMLIIENEQFHKYSFDIGLLWDVLKEHLSELNPCNKPRLKRYKEEAIAARTKTIQYLERKNND